MILKTQKHLFELSEEVTYLNGAYMSPQLKSVTKIGIAALTKKASPQAFTLNDFFDEQTLLKKRFSQLVEAPDYRNIAIIPSVSYGIATVAKNIHLQKGDEIILLNEQFPSNIYSWLRLEQETGCTIKTISPPKNNENRGEIWNEKILKAISPNTKVVAIPQVHWADGTLFNLKDIRAKTNAVGAYLIIDGTQSVGAFPFSIKEIQPDALICAGYKWLMGPYALGVAYYSDRFCDGIPIEESWINRENSENFSELVNYNHNYQPKAGRFNVGEASNFILTPMLSESINQLIKWEPTAIQEYCKSITKEAIENLIALGCFIEKENFRGHHLFGIYLPKEKNINTIKERLTRQNIVVSYRGNAIRIAPNIYNTKEELNKLAACFK